MERSGQARSLTRRLKALLRDRLPERLVDRLRDLSVSTHWVPDLYRFHLSASDTGSLSGQARSALRTTQALLDRKWVLFRPEVPARGHAMYKICLQLGYRITSDRTRPFAIAMRWSDTTFAPDDEVLSRLADGHLVLNLACQDTSKARVADTFARVFGYTLAVDPRVYQGKCVRKSDRNAQHDGSIVDAPRDPEPGFVYQRLIDNEVEGGLVQDMRMPVIGRQIPFVYLKYRPTEIRFKNRNIRVELARVDEVLSRQEAVKVREFCDAMRLDYGEIDVLRNREDGKVYIVDVNATPSGPPNHISREGERAALGAMARAFTEVLAGVDREHPDRT
jgi:hypothetical protein